MLAVFGKLALCRETFVPRMFKHFVLFLQKLEPWMRFGSMRDAECCRALACLWVCGAVFHCAVHLLCLFLSQDPLRAGFLHPYFVLRPPQPEQVGLKLSLSAVVLSVAPLLSLSAVVQSVFQQCGHAGFLFQLFCKVWPAGLSFSSVATLGFSFRCCAVCGRAWCCHGLPCGFVRRWCRPA